MFKEKPWLKFYEPHVPEHIDYPHTTIPESLAEMANKFPDRTAMIYKDNPITYREYNQAVDCFAAALQGLGVKKGDRVAIHLLNTPQFPITYNAILRIGGICVPCNPIYTAREMKHQLNDSHAETIITLTSMYPLIQQIRPETALQHVIVAEIDTYFPEPLKSQFAMLKQTDPKWSVDISGEANTYLFTDLMNRGPVKPEPVQIDWEDTAVLMYTGGTTGISKGAQLTHKNILVNAVQVKTWINGSEEDSTLTTIPLYHSYAMTCCMNVGAVTGGSAIIIPDPRDTDDILRNIEKHKPAFYPGVPAMYVAIANHPDVMKYDLTSLRACNSGAAPMPVEVQQKFEKITGARLVEGYGLSEASPVTHTNPAFGDSRIGTIGLPYPDTEAMIVDVDTGEQEVGVDELGELCIRGPQVMKGYWNMPTETANALRDHGDGGGPWLHTGDIATMDQDGYFRIVDRKKDMILGSGGYNIYPREVEEVLYEHPKVLEAAVAGVLVSQGNQRVKAFVVLKKGETATEEEMIDFCRQNLAPYKVPKFVEFRDSLPKTQVGKILRRELTK
jgi:long-chain acyl-CoA synthetase